MRCPSGATDLAGLYLHVPFCRRRCGYCDFNVATGSTAGERARYAQALEVELATVAAAGPRAVAPPGTDVEPTWPTFTSVFVGGGTPTLLEPPDLAGVLRRAHDVLPVAPDAEITVEANPENLSVERLAPLVDAGLTRVSIGAQSFAPGVLAFLDRDHDPTLPLEAVTAARAAGVRSVNLDLIYGAPAETDADWSRTLEVAIAAGTDHVSCYALTLEEGTGYAARVRGGEQPAPDDDVGADRMTVADERLTANGFIRYELSNWARPGHASVHNQTYWADGDWLGIGAGAHGHWRGRRWWALRSATRWADAALAGTSTIAGEEVTTPQERRTERLLLGLRRVAGVERAAVAPLDEAAIRRLVARGLLDDDGRRLALTPAGFPLANAVTAALL